jgi:hypothetical protein
MQPLRWFRLNGGGGAWLAFFALACQLVLTFGHVHFAGPRAISTALAGSSATAAIEGAAPAPASPEQQPPSGLATDFCAVCSNIALANALVLPSPPRAGSPVSSASNRAWLPATAGVETRDHFHFSARGPPASDAASALAAPARFPVSPCEAGRCRSIELRRRCDEKHDPVRLRPRHHFPGQRRSDLWDKLARSAMRIPRAVLSPGMARRRNRPVGRSLRCLEDVPESAQEIRRSGGDHPGRFGYPKWITSPRRHTPHRPAAHRDTCRETARSAARACAQHPPPSPTARRYIAGRPRRTTPARR